MTPVQGQLFEQPAPPRNPDALQIWRGLKKYGWVSAKDISRTMGWGEGEAGKRRVRKAANASKGTLLSAPGSKGYIRSDEISGPEMQHMMAAMKHQRDQMDQRYIEMSQTYHKRYGKREDAA